jgi:hypothetical protein
MGRSEGPKGLFMALVGAAAGVAGTAAYTRYALGEMPRYLKLQDEVLYPQFASDKFDNLGLDDKTALNKKRIDMLEQYIWYLHSRLGLLLPDESPFKDREAALKDATDHETIKALTKSLEEAKAAGQKNGNQ